MRTGIPAEIFTFQWSAPLLAVESQGGQLGLRINAPTFLKQYAASAGMK